MSLTSMSSYREYSSFTPPHYLQACTETLPNMEGPVCKKNQLSTKIHVELENDCIVFSKSYKYLDVWLVGVAAVVILSTLCCHVIARKSRGHGKRGWSKICNDQCCPMVRILPKAGLGIWCRGKWRDRDLETLISSEALRMSHAPLQESWRTSRGT